MNLPQPEEFIDIHTHGSTPVKGIFAVENLMAHEELVPEKVTAKIFTVGIHPWYLNESNKIRHIEYVKDISSEPRLIALGEAGFDKLRGPSMELQRSVFMEQAKIAGGLNKPLIIHCVKAWDELLIMHRLLKPAVPWLVHGFRGKRELASQLLSRGMYISFWFDFIVRSESSDLVRSIPRERIFLETDGSDTDIRDIYSKVANDLGIGISELKNIIIRNFNELFGGQKD
ncbi:MAG TPA: TatD family hydrolase [Bacteroidales bacterium]|jgi:TatD DNase family protein|nr:TatD family hydrolase [Bacteroidales bacterium]